MAYPQIRLSDDFKRRLVYLAERWPEELAQLLAIDPEETEALADEIGECHCRIENGPGNGWDREDALVFLEVEELAEGLARELNRAARAHRAALRRQREVA